MPAGPRAILTRGGTVEVLIERIVPAERPEITAFLEAAARHERAALVRPVTGPAASPGRALLLRPGGPGRGAVGPADFDRTAGSIPLTRTSGAIHPEAVPRRTPQVPAR
jgi:xanthine/CO dehydrogenase XdhC/CoxF family maturation factor